VKEATGFVSSQDNNSNYNCNCFTAEDAETQRKTQRRMELCLSAPLRLRGQSVQSSAFFASSAVQSHSRAVQFRCSALRPRVSAVRQL